MPARGWHHIVSDKWPVCRHATPNRDVAIARLIRPVGELSELVVTLAGQEHLGKPVARHVMARDPHAPDLKFVPAVRSRVEAGRLPLLDPPELFLTVAVVVLVVCDPQVASPGSVPVAEENGEGAPAGAQQRRIRVGRALGPEHEVVGAVTVLPALFVKLDVHADRQGWQRSGPFPRCGEIRPSTRPTIEPECLVRSLESQLPRPRNSTDVLTEAQHRQIRVSVRIDIDRIGARDFRQIGPGAANLRKSQRTSNRALVDVERCGIRSAGEVEILLAIVVAVERRDATTPRSRSNHRRRHGRHRSLRLLDKARGTQCLGRCGSRLPTSARRQN